MTGSSVLFPHEPIRVSTSPAMRAWGFEEPRLFAVQLDEHSVDIAHSHFIIEAFDAVLHRFGPGRLTCLHDWRMLEHYTVRSRRELLAWGHRVNRQTESATFVMPKTSGPLLRMAGTVSSAAMSAIGMKVEFQFEDSMELALERLGLGELAMGR